MAVKLPDADSLLIAYSGGKDSLATLDICCRAGKCIEAFFMYFIPGMDYSDFWCRYAEQRWAIPVRRYQHWNTSYYLRHGLFREPVKAPKVTILDIEAAVREDSGLEWIGYGYKSIDSLQRRGMMNKWVDGINPVRKIFTPIKTWNNTDVRSYLSRRRIDIPVQINAKRSSGMDLSPQCMEWMRREWPDDYRRVLKIFPHAEAQADRAAYIREQDALSKV